MTDRGYDYEQAFCVNDFELIYFYRHLFWERYRRRHRLDD